jgi:hypothetical protein
MSVYKRYAEGGERGDEKEDFNRHGRTKVGRPEAPRPQEVQMDVRS